ncbi:MAG: hypothetical protein LUB83_00670 [Prevotellaceae bacterium]|nr:hypothetical protein [Prevotellaceae bacterium]
MDTKFQDSIDNYLTGRLTAEEEKRFLEEVAGDKQKKEQLEFTRQVKETITSREEKLKALAGFKKRYEDEHTPFGRTGTDSGIRFSVSEKGERPMPSYSQYMESRFEETERRAKSKKSSSKKIWLWVAGIAAVIAVGVFVISPLFMATAPDPKSMMPEDHPRGDDEVFGPKELEEKLMENMSEERAAPEASEATEASPASQDTITVSEDGPDETESE